MYIFSPHRVSFIRGRPQGNVTPKKGNYLTPPNEKKYGNILFLQDLLPGSYVSQTPL